MVVFVLWGTEMAAPRRDALETEFDRRLGRRLRSLRHLRGVSQTELGGLAGITYQQLQKYETGENRISASRLVSLARCLGIGPQAFFDGLTEPADTDIPLIDAELGLLLRSYAEAPPNVRKAVLGLLASLART